MRPIRNHRKRWIFGITFIVVLVLIRAALPAIIQPRLNKFLAEFSPVYILHVEDLDISLLRMAYRFENATGQLRKNGHEFLTIESVDVSIAWRELARGQIHTDIEVSGMKLTGDPMVLTASTSKEAEPEKDAKEVKDNLFPLRVTRLIVRNSSIEIGDVVGLPEEKKLVLREVEARVNNLTPEHEMSQTLFTVQGSILGSSVLKLTGKAELKREPKAWDIDLEMRDFNLVEANPILIRMVPFTFTSGRMDLFGEIKSEDNEMIGYVKPFLRDADIIDSKEKYKNGKQFFVEIGSALGNWVLQRDKDKTTATKINFKRKNGKMEYSLGEVLGNAIEHKTGTPFTPQIEDIISIKE